MKRLKKALAFLLAMVLCLGMTMMNVSAASSGQDGLEVTLTADKDQYRKGEKITATLTVTNTNDESVSNITMENIIPDGYSLADGLEAVKKVESLAPGETVSMTVTYVVDKTDDGTDDGKKPSDDSDGNKGAVGGTDSSENAGPNESSNNTETNTNKTSGSKVQTGDNANVMLWIVILLVAGTVIIGISAYRNKKKGKRFLSLFLSFILLGSLISATSMQVNAAEEKNMFSISEDITVESDNVTLEAVISYDNLDTGLADSDSDGLCDEDEDAFGTDSMNPDTDNDGLTDLEEIILGTDPLVPNDYDEGLDSDEDSLTDLEEIQDYGTDPVNSDTDGDGLSDYDEIKIYGTDPTKADSDNDGLSDGFEIEHGFDPINESTNGTANDGEIPIEQTIADKGISLALRDDSNLAKPSISGTASGELADNVFLATSTDSAFSDNRSVVGKAVYVEGENEYINGLTLSFDVSAYEGNFENIYIVLLNDDGIFEPVESVLTGTVISGQIKKSGTYCVLDLNDFLTNLGFDLSPYWEDLEASIATYSLEEEYVDPNAVVVDQYAGKIDIDENEDYDETTVTDLSDNGNTGNEESISGDEVASSSLYSTYSAEDMSEEYKAQIDNGLLEALNETNEALMSSTVSGQADIVFAIDTTGSMSTTITNVVTNVTSFATTLSENYNVNVNYALVDYKDLEEDGAGTTVVVKNGSSNWFTNVDAFVNKVKALKATGGGDTPECSVDALETARRLNFRSTANKFIILITDASYKTANGYGIESMDEEIELLKADGIVTSVVTTTGYQSDYKSLYESTGGIFANIRSSSFSSSLLSLADMIGEITSDGTWVILKHGFRYVRLSDETDQDGDDLSTTYELGEKVELDMTPLIYAQLLMHRIPIENYLGETTITVYDAVSDPTMADSDSDGIADADDTAPWKKGLSGGIIGEMNMLAVPGDVATAIIVTGNSGHSFLVYKSYVNDEFDLSSWNGGYTKNSGSWVDAIVQKDPPNDYKINAGDYFAFSAGGNDDFSASCAIYNMEFYKHWNSPYYTYGTNHYFTEDVTQTKIEKMFSVMEEEATKNYNIFTHTCTHVSLNVWNAMYDTGIDPLGMNTPRNLYSWMGKNGASTNFNLDSILE
ncbi:MAG: VWA domain-containing protein [Oliverpabstia sp.]